MKYLILALFVLGLFSSANASAYFIEDSTEDVTTDGRKDNAKVTEERVIEIAKYEDNKNSSSKESDTTAETQSIKFPDNVTALEIEDVYDIRVMAYQVNGDMMKHLVLEVPNQPESYPRLTAILTVLQDQGISHRDIRINVNKVQGTQSDDVITMAIEDRPLMFAYQDNAPQSDLASR